MKYGVLLGALALVATLSARVVAMPGDDYWDHQWSGNHDNDKSYQHYPDYREWPVDQTYKSPLYDADRQYLDTAAQADRAEIQIAGVAMSNSSSDEVKRYADMLQNDHKDHLKHLHWIAGYLNYGLAQGINNDEQTELTSLTALQGGAFDDAFRLQMMGDHEAAIQLTLNECANGHSWWLKQYAHDSLATLETHLAYAQDYLPYTRPAGLVSTTSTFVSPGASTSTMVLPNGGATSTTVTPNGTVSTTTTPTYNGTTTTTTTTNPNDLTPNTTTTTTTPNGTSVVAPSGTTVTTPNGTTTAP
jgi:putative membrane protein